MQMINPSETTLIYCDRSLLSTHASCEPVWNETPFKIISDWNKSSPPEGGDGKKNDVMSRDYVKIMSYDIMNIFSHITNAAHSIPFESSLSSSSFYFEAFRSLARSRKLILKYDL